MDYMDILNRVGSSLEKDGIEFKYEYGKPVSETDIFFAEQQLRCKVPTQLSELYIQAGDGVELYWDLSSEDDDDSLYSMLRIPSLKMLIYNRTFLLDKQLPGDMESIDKLPEGPEKERSISLIKQKESFVPFHDEGNGDQVCIEMAGDQKVVFLNHESEDICYMAPSFEDFIVGWSTVCFQQPRETYWPDCVKEGAVDWSCEEFREPKQKE